MFACVCVYVHIYEYMCVVFISGSVCVCSGCLVSDNKFPPHVTYCTTYKGDQKINVKQNPLKLVVTRVPVQFYVEQ